MATPTITNRPTQFRLFDAKNFLDYRQRWSEIDQLFPALGDPEFWDVVAAFRRQAREDLRAEMRTWVNLGPAQYLVPV